MEYNQNRSSFRLLKGFHYRHQANGAKAATTASVNLRLLSPSSAPKADRKFPSHLRSLLIMFAKDITALKKGAADIFRRALFYNIDKQLMPLGTSPVPAP